MIDPDRHEMMAGNLRASVLAHGAELCSLRDASGREWLWQAGPAWPRHAPNLFPIVGRLAGDQLRVGSETFRLTQHGFARDRRFAWLDRSATTCRLVLQDDAATRAMYPFRFFLEIGCTLSEVGLTVTYLVTNPGDKLLPFSIGAHPAFAWPLHEGMAKEAHRLEFEHPEPAPIRRLQDGLLLPQSFPTPIEERVLPLTPSLFAADAVILDRVQNSSVRYLAADATGLEVTWSGFRELGLWSRAGGDFLCIEPWTGYASPADFDGAFADKPGLVLLPPAQTRRFEWALRIIS